MLTRVISLFFLLATLTVTSSVAPAPAAAAANCQFVLGFKAIHDMIPDTVGDCRTNEYHNAQNGDGLQETTGVNGKGGLLVWRKADNWTAYTDGFHTWVNGPNGLQQRLNTERFSFEKDPIAAPQPATQYGTFDTADQTLRIPKGWIPDTYRNLSGIIEPKGHAAIIYMAPFKMGAGFKVEEFLIATFKANDNRNDLVLGGVQNITVNGLPAARLDYEFPGVEKGFLVAVQKGSNVYFLEFFSVASEWSKWGPILEECLQGYVAKSG